MALTERSRQEMYQAFEQKVGKEAALTLLEHLPPIGWADVATKEYVDNKFAILDEKMNAMEERILRKTENMMRQNAFAIIAANVAIFGLFATILKLT